MTVGIDVGNTAIKIARDRHHDVRVHRVTDPGATDSISHYLAELSASSGGLEVRIASVNRGAASKLIERTAALVGERVPFRCVSHRDVPIRIAAEHPDRVGIDRIVGALGAREHYQTPLVLVDAGTTVTVDLVDGRGVYCGGAILPGLEMQTAALHSGTDALPQIDWRSPCSAPGPGSVIGKNTLDAMRLGILSSVVGGIERLVRLYKTPKCVVVTGGDSKCLFDLLHGAANRDFDVHHHAHLVCRTLASFTWKAKEGRH